MTQTPTAVFETLVRRRSKILATLLTHGILVAMCMICIVPFIWLTFATFKPYAELVSSSALLPRTWTLANYTEILTRAHFANAFANSVIVATLATLFILITSSAAGYVFARYRFPGRDTLFWLLLSSMMVPGTLTLVPLYVTISDMKMVNQLSGLIVPGLWSTFGIFLLRQFIADLPSELFDAARIDGASEWRVFFTIVIPLAMSPMAALAILTFLGSWDGFMWPLIILSDPMKQTLPVLLNGLRSMYWSRYELWATGAMLTILPVMVVYAVFSRYFIRGFAMTGIK